jgi:hypothetical protein
MNATLIPNVSGLPMLIAVDIDENSLTILLLVRLMKDQTDDSFDHFLSFVQRRLPDSDPTAFVINQRDIEIVALARLLLIT